MRPALRAILALALLGGLVAWPSAVLGHALLLSSDPAAGTSVSAAPGAVALTFSEAPEASLTRVRVLDAAGTDRAGGPVEPVPGDNLSIRVPLVSLPEGVYTVSWRTVSAVDGHVSAGSFAFGVGGAPVPPPEAPQGEAPASGSLPAVVARWLLYLGLGSALGAAFVGGVLHPRPPRRLVALATGGATIAAIGTVGIVTMQWLESGASIGTFAASAIGVASLGRALTIGVLGAGVLALVQSGPPGVAPSRQRVAYALVGATASVAVLVEVAAGHAAAGERPLVSLAVQSVHALGALAWMGGLGALLLAVQGLPTDEKSTAVRRYSTAAGVLLAFVALSGLARALDQVGTMGGLVGSDFGRLALLKSLGLLGLAGLGALNRFVNMRAVARSLGGLRRTGSVELAGGAMVLLLTAALVNAVPPASAGPAPTPAGAPVVATGHDFGTSVRVRLRVSPGTAGFNDFEAQVVDFDSQAPVAGTAVTLRFTSASDAGVAPSRLELPAASPGVFVASGGNLALDGIWRVTALVPTDQGSVEVPLVLATSVPSLPVASDPSVSPVLYDVTVPAVGTVQLYLDPGTAGENDLHVTFFDPAGMGLAVPNVTISVVEADGFGTLLDAVALLPGHFVAKVAVPDPGPLRVDVVGTTPAGARIHLSLDMELGP